MSTLSDSQFDAVLLLSFGGPEGREDVMPFLHNVTRGRNIPPERLADVAEHYYHFDGVSPINAINRELRERLARGLTERGIALPVYWGNRNWHPMLEDTVTSMVADGVRQVLVLPTSAYGGYSACRQYDEDILRARAHVGEAAPQMEKLPHTYHNDLFVQINADAVRRALDELGRSQFDASTRLVFTAHSIPNSADDNDGPEGHLYAQQLAVAAKQVAALVGAADYDLVWQSRSGPPQVPWLEPDICDHLVDVAATGANAVVVAPIGFVSDHLEVIWDLDTEAREAATDQGMSFARVATASDDPRFIDMYVELIAQRLGLPATVSHYCEPLQSVCGVSINGAPCAPGCCGSAR